ncbi:MAG: preprotein translocase subunit SecY [Planctomycetia bacterium]|nr:preprotein translocase subunit SecY [Planctomycetia bacterium]
MNTLYTIFFRIPELQQKILITIIFLAVYRIGYHIPLPMIDQQQIADQFSGLGGGFGQLLAFASVFSGSQLSAGTIFGLGIMPYISASIIFQLLATFYPPLEKLQKEGESGRKKINEYTRYATVPICLVQSYIYVNSFILAQQGGGKTLFLPGWDNFFDILTAVMIMTCGTMFLMWIGEQIDEYGIGNGISLIIMAGIVSRIPEAFKRLFFIENGTKFNWGIFEISSSGQGANLTTLIVLILLFILVVYFVVLITKAQRHIATQSAKHVRGRRVYGGMRQSLPLRLNHAGVMPVIFASSLLMVPFFLLSMINNLVDNKWSFGMKLANEFQEQGYIYNLLYVVGIFGFSFFWVAITFNPKEVANNLRDQGSFIPGYRPGKRTEEYLNKVMTRITLVGAAFLSLIAVLPTVIARGMKVDYMVASFFGGTSLLIVISVCLDLVQKINSHLVMRNYQGVTED